MNERRITTSRLKKFNASDLKDMGNDIYIIHGTHSDEPLAVLLSYELYLKIYAVLRETVQ